MGRPLPPPLPWERKPSSPPSLPWERVSHYPGYTEHNNPAVDNVEGESQAIAWIPMGSSNVDAIAWVEAADYKLFVRFHDKGDGKGSAVYQYDVNEDVYDSFFSASSPGRYVWFVLRKGGYPYRRVY